MAYKKKSTGPNRLVLGIFSLVMVLSLGVFVYASQNQTNTETEASNGRLIPGTDYDDRNYSCSRDPQLSLDRDKTRGFDTSVAYIIRVKNVDKHNPNNKNCLPDTYHFNVNVPRGWSYNVESLEGRGKITLDEGESDFVSLQIIRPSNEKRDVYDIKFGVYNSRHDDNTSDATMTLKYTVE
jgi:hypothetical protein